MPTTYIYRAVNGKLERLRLLIREDDHPQDRSLVIRVNIDEEANWHMIPEMKQ